MQNPHQNCMAKPPIKTPLKLANPQLASGKCAIGNCTKFTIGITPMHFMNDVPHFVTAGTKYWPRD
jgi:hypothetical protein